MVGAVILFVLALVAGIIGVLLWGHGLGSEDDASLLQGYVILAISAIALTGALVIDGIRFYANRVTQQLEWIIRRTGGVSSNSNLGHIEAGNPLGSAKLIRFHIVGKSRESGEKAELVVQAVDQMAAYRTGEKAGIEVTQVEPIEETAG